MEANHPPKKGVYFPNLDGFRTIAFLIVFLGHCYILFDFGERTKTIKRLGVLFGRPGAGVHFFFVLSGFLISYLLLTELKKYGKINIKAFYMRRVLRIWPVYFLVVGICVLLSLLNKLFYSLHDVSFPMVGLFLTNFNLAGAGISSLPLTVLWSVAVEEQFYLFLPLLIWLFGRKIFYVFPLFIAGSLLFGQLHIRDVAFTEFHTVSVCSSLFLGCIMAYLVLFYNFADLFGKLRKWQILLVYIAFFTLHIFRDKIFPPDRSGVWLYFIYSLFFAFFIMEQNFAKSSFYKMQRLRLLTASGKYTYGLYAYHMIFISLLLLFIPAQIDPARNYFIYFSLWAGALSAAYLFSKASYIFMEKPFLKIKEKFSRK